MVTTVSGKHLPWNEPQSVMFPLNLLHREITHNHILYLTPQDLLTYRSADLPSIFSPFLPIYRQEFLSFHDCQNQLRETLTWMWTFFFQWHSNTLQSGLRSILCGARDWTQGLCCWALFLVSRKILQIATHSIPSYSPWHCTQEKGTHPWSPLETTLNQGYFMNTWRSELVWCSSVIILKFLIFSE